MFEYLADHWLAVCCLVAALALGVASGLRRYLVNIWPWQLYLPATVLAAYGIGALVDLPTWLALVLILAPAGFFLAMIVVVIFRGDWLAPLAYGVTALFFFGLGTSTGADLQTGVRAD